MTRYHHGDLRAAILAEARAVIDAHGDGDLSLRSLATAVGVSPNAPYRHFPVKESLLAALAGEGFAELTARFHSHDGPDGRTRLEGYLTEYLQFTRRSPGLYRLMFGRDLDPLSCDPDLGVQAQACFRALMSAVSQVTGQSPDAPGVAREAAMVWSLSHGAALLDIDRATAFLPSAERPHAADLARLLIEGLVARAPAAAATTDHANDPQGRRIAEVEDGL